MAQEVSDLANEIIDDTFWTVDVSKLGNFNMGTNSIASSNVAYGYSNVTLSSGFSTTGANFHVQGDAVFDGDITIKGRSVADSLTAIENRLAILVPDPKKLEHFEALKKAYENYKTLEALCQLPSDKNENI